MLPMYLFIYFVIYGYTEIDSSQFRPHCKDFTNKIIHALHYFRSIILPFTGNITIMVLAGIKAAHLLLVNHTTKSVHCHHYQHHHHHHHHHHHLHILLILKKRLM